MDQGTMRQLSRLYRICKAGEWGFEVSAENVSNRGLKVILKSFSQQRAAFAREIKEMVEKEEGSITTRRSIRGIIHRGRIAIRGAMTIGAQNVENGVLNEILLGEEAATKTYKSVLGKTLPADAQTLIERQFEEMQATFEELRLLRGRSGQRLVVRLFDSEHDTDTALQALTKAGFERRNIDVAEVQAVTKVYEGQSHKLDETIISGAVGGAIWGGILGAIIGLNFLLFPNIGAMMGNPAESWAFSALGGTLIGALFGAILGLLIGRGISEEDAYLYDDSVRHGVNLIQLTTNNERSAEAAHIMHDVNAAARTRASIKSA